MQSNYRGELQQTYLNVCFEVLILVWVLLDFLVWETADEALELQIIIVLLELVTSFTELVDDDTFRREGEPVREGSFCWLCLTGDDIDHDNHEEDEVDVIEEESNEEVSIRVRLSSWVEVTTKAAVELEWPIDCCDQTDEGALTEVAGVGVAEPVITEECEDVHKHDEEEVGEENWLLRYPHCLHNVQQVRESHKNVEQVEEEEERTHNRSDHRSYPVN